MGEMSSGDFDAREAVFWSVLLSPRLSGLSGARRDRQNRPKRPDRRTTRYELRVRDGEGGFLQGVEQLLGHFQITSACTDFDVRFGDAVEIASTGH